MSVLESAARRVASGSLDLDAAADMVARELGKPRGRVGDVRQAISTMLEAIEEEKTRVPRPTKNEMAKISKSRLVLDEVTGETISAGALASRRLRRRQAAEAAS